MATALLYAVDVLEVDHIIVFGHSHCGGIQALMKADEDIDPEHQGIRDWANIAAQAKQNTMQAHPNLPFEDLCQKCEFESVKLSLDNLLSYPWINSRISQATLQLHGWVFDLEKGTIQSYDQQNDALTDLAHG